MPDTPKGVSQTLSTQATDRLSSKSLRRSTSGICTESYDNNNNNNNNSNNNSNSNSGNYAHFAIAADEESLASAKKVGVVQSGDSKTKLTLGVLRRRQMARFFGVARRRNTVDPEDDITQDSVET